MINTLIHGDCLDIMKQISDASIDMILCDLPYGTTQCKWDVIIPFDKLWEQYNRIIKDNAPIVLTASQPFTSLLIASNIDMFKYNWIWEKSKATGYLNSKKRPLVAHEDVLVFSKKVPKYFPQMTQGKPYTKGEAHRPTDCYGKQTVKLVENKSGLRFPRSVIYFKTAESEGEVIHGTQKPVALFEYLIKTYTLENDIILDNCIGSGTTAIACKNTKRQFIGIEKDKNIFDMAIKRIEQYDEKTST